MLSSTILTWCANKLDQTTTAHVDLFLAQRVLTSVVSVLTKRFTLGGLTSYGCTKMRQPSTLLNSYIVSLDSRPIYQIMSHSCLHDNLQLQFEQAMNGSTPSPFDSLHYCIQILYYIGACMIINTECKVHAPFQHPLDSTWMVDERCISTTGLWGIERPLVKEDHHQQ